MKDKFGLTSFHNSKLFRARCKARGGSNEAHVEEYKLLRYYSQMVLNTNPGSIVMVASETIGNPPHFKKIFKCMEVYQMGFIEGCKRVIGMDDCHLKGPFGGIALVVVSLDANLQFFSLAYSLVEIEDKHTWAWFSDPLGHDLQARP